MESLRKKNLKPEISVLEECDSEEEANQAEKNWIMVLGLAGVDLTNLTLGGDGVIPTEETRRKMSESARARFNTEEGRAKQSYAASCNKTPRKDFLLSLTKTAKYREALSAAQKKQSKEKMSQMSRKGWSDPLVASKRLAGLKSNPELRLERMKEAIRSPEVQAKRIASRRLKHK